MNLIKHLEFFNTATITDPIHVIGVGAIGSSVVELLVRLGFENIHIYDFDTVTDYNVTNQMYRTIDIGEKKTTALMKICKDINPEVKIVAHPIGWTENCILSGYVFLAVDSIELRKKIATHYKDNAYIKAMFDFRMSLTSAQHYAAIWSDEVAKTNFINTMNFTDEEAKAATPVSACNTTLSIAPTVRSITSFGVANFFNLLKGEKLRKVILVDAFKFESLAF